MLEAYPATDLPAYCRKCRETGGCDKDPAATCPRPQLLPECLPAMLAHGVCETQWRYGFSGATGLDYTACLASLTVYLPQWQAGAAEHDAIHDMDVPTLMDDLRTIERALLDAWAENAAKDAENKPPKVDQ